MKTNAYLSAALLVFAVSGLAAAAQDTNTNPPPAAAPSVAAPAAATTINGLVYVAQLPTPTQLLKDAEAEGLTIARIDQSPDKLVVVYQYPDGHTRAFAYQPMTSAAPAAPVAPVSSATYTVISTPPPAPNVIYSQPATVIYQQPPTVYYSTRYYDPVWDFWAPLAIGVGIGWSTGGHGHYYHGGGYYGGHHGWHH
jgi:hypothetical protein